MATRYHYSSTGEYQGYSSDTPPGCGAVVPVIAGLVIAIILMASFLDWAITCVTQYHRLPQPYRCVGGFYYYTLAVPFGTLVEGFCWSILLVWNRGLTPYPNFNAVLALTTYAVVAWLVVAGWKKLEERESRHSPKGAKHFLICLATAAAILIAPTVFAIFWWIGSGLFLWLFAR